MASKCVTYMMEQETDKIFKISVGKIDRDEEVTIKIQYIDKFEILLEVSKYQETKLSNKFAEDALMNNIWDMFGMDECEEKCCDMYLPSFLKSRSSSNSSNDLDIPCFLRKNKKVKSESKTLEVKKTNKEILEDKIDEYYKVFFSQNEKSILTFLLYTI